MYTANASMPHVTTSPEYNNRLVYQGNQLENSSPSLGNSYHNASSMGYYNYPTANVQQSYPGEYQSANNGVHMSVGDQRCGTVDDRASNNFLNLSTSRNPFPNATSSSHEYYSLQNMDNREAYPCQHSVSQGQVNARRVCRSPSVESSAVRKTTSWTDAMFASMDRVGGTILDLVSEDAMEFERIAATIKQDCKSPNSADALLPNDFGPISMPSVGAMSDLSYSRWSRPQFGDPNPRRKRSPRSDQAYAPDDYVLSNDFQEFNLDSPPGQDYNRYGDMYGLPNPVGHFSSNPNLGAYVRNNYPHQQSYLSDLQTYHGASPYTPYRQNYGSDNIRIGSEVMLSEAPCSYFKSCSKDRGGRARSKQSESLEDLKLLPDGITSRAENSKKHKSEAKNRMCIGEDFKSLLGKRKAEQTEDHEVQFKKQKFYFEREEHYVVHKLLRELSIVNIPSDLPRTTSASLFYHLLSSKTEPRVMQTVGGSTTSSRQRKIIVRDDVSEEQIVKYSHVGSHPFVYKHGAASRASPTKSLKLIELLTAKSPKPEDSSKENKENKDGTGNAEEKVSENLENDSQKEAEVVNDAIR